MAASIASKIPFHLAWHGPARLVGGTFSLACAAVWTAVMVPFATLNVVSFGSCLSLRNICRITASRSVAHMIVTTMIVTGSKEVDSFSALIIIPFVIVVASAKDVSHTIDSSTKTFFTEGAKKSNNRYDYMYADRLFVGVAKLLSSPSRLKQEVGSRLYALIAGIGMTLYAIARFALVPFFWIGFLFSYGTLSSKLARYVGEGGYYGGTILYLFQSALVGFLNPAAVRPIDPCCSIPMDTSKLGKDFLDAWKRA